MQPVGIAKETSFASRYLGFAEEFYSKNYPWPRSVFEWEMYNGLKDFARFLGYECFRKSVSEDDLQSYIRKTPHLTLEWFVYICPMCAKFIRYYWCREGEEQHGRLL